MRTLLLAIIICTLVRVHPYITSANRVGESLIQLLSWKYFEGFPNNAPTRATILELSKGKSKKIHETSKSMYPYILQQNMKKQFTTMALQMQ